MAKLSSAELAKREDIIKTMKKNKRGLVKRYGSDAEKVMYGRATNIAKKVTETQMEQSNLKELVRAALMQEKAGFSKEFDSDPALKGGQKNLPDGLQKAIISKAKPANEDLDLGHEDDEPHMLKSDLYHIGKYAMNLYQMVDQFEGKGEVDFPHWWQSKIIKAKEMMSSAKHYLDFELKEPEIDAAVDVIDASDALNSTDIDEATNRKMDESVKILDRQADLDRAYFNLDVDGTEMGFSYWDYDEVFDKPTYEEVMYMIEKQLIKVNKYGFPEGSQLTPEQKEEIAQVILKDLRTNPGWKSNRKMDESYGALAEKIAKQLKSR